MVGVATECTTAGNAVVPDLLDLHAELEPHLRRQAEAASFQYFLEAVGLEAGRVSLDRDPDPVLTRSRPAPEGQVPQVAFRDALGRLGGRADLVKVDCEGAEWSFLGDRDSWRQVRYLSMEYHLWPSHTVPELILYALELWHRQHLRIPATDDWDRAGPNHPSRVTVMRRFGSWNTAIVAAGFRPRRPGQRRTPSFRARCPDTGRFVPAG